MSTINVESIRTRPKLLTLDEAAELTRLSPATLRYWRAQATGEGPKSGKLGGRVFYREADVLAWIDAQFEDEGNAA